MAHELAAHGGGVGDATFVTRSIPDISPNAGLVALCTVPGNRAGPDDLGWHIADFLAFKTILGGYLHENAQTWLAHCDIAKLIKANPEAYTHGADRRIFSPGKLTDNIRVESPAAVLIKEFSAAITKTVDIVKKYEYDLVIIICGPTTLEQDAYFGNAIYRPYISSTDIRAAIGSDDCSAMVITPALFSAGWQVNPSFCRHARFNPRVERVHFMAKQFGAIFARSIVDKVTSWDCPMLDSSRVDPTRKGKVRYPGFQKASPENTMLQVALQSALAARLMQEHSDHSFSFDGSNDDWVKLIRTRKHRTLAEHQHEWEKLPTAQTPVSIDPDRLYQGNVFGGVKASQLAHLKHLIRDSLMMWQGVWVNELGRGARAKFQEFLFDEDPHESDCLEMVYVMEQRSTLLVMGDLLVDLFNLPVPDGKRCRDYDGTSAQSGRTGLTFDLMCKSIPGVNLHPDRSVYKFGKIQAPHYRDAHYVVTALGELYTDSTSLDAAVGRIRNLFDVIKDRQLRLLFENPDIRQKCRLWLTAINMPVLSVPRFNTPRLAYEDSSALPNIVMSALSISRPTTSHGMSDNHRHAENKTTGSTQVQKGPFTASHGVSNNHGHVENKIAVSTKAEEKSSPVKGSVALDKRPGNVIVQGKAGISLSGMTATSMGTSKGTSDGISDDTTDRASNDTLTKLGIRQKAMAYVTGNIAIVSPEDAKLALEMCPDLKDALLNRMLTGETIDPPPSTTQTPVRQSVTSAFPSTQERGDSRTTTGDPEQTTDEGQAVIPKLWVRPDMRGEEGTSSALHSTQVRGDPQTTTSDPKKLADEGRAAFQVQPVLWPHLSGRQNTNSSLSSTQPRGDPQGTTKK
ncbi:hypothetical protein SLS62_011181 [Diatrype stigma]|uniref:Uncharacterized protein n=1 Tax=Diatrype stigma TaxID=117547 RepID=A0AAN9UDD3_9PEZI